MKRAANWLRIFMILAGIVLCVVICGVLASQKLTVSFYTVHSPKIPEGKSIRVVLLSDLHNREFGQDNAELIARISELSPDLIVMAGDMFSKGDPDTETVLSLCANLKQIAPVFFGLGNHEGTMLYNEGIPLDEMLKEEDVSVLINSTQEILVQDIPILIGGISSTPETYDEFSKEFIAEFEEAEEFKILIAHVPALFYEKMASSNIDLAVSGHYHGGIVQIPGVGGLYSAEDGFFPRYCNGLFELENGWLLVTRGLGNSTWIPRINNPPELVVVDICR